MGKPGNATFSKKKRERDRKMRKEEKQELRAVRKEQKKNRQESIEEGVDPDLIGIFPGPQRPIED